MRAMLHGPMDLLMAGGMPAGPQLEPVAPHDDAARLNVAFTSYIDQHAFNEGALVREKEPLRAITNVRSPTNLFVVLKLIDARLTPEESLRSGVFGSTPDVVLGYYTEDGDFAFVCADSTRFEPVGDVALGEMTVKFQEERQRRATDEQHSFVSEAGTGACDVCGQSYAAHPRRSSLRDHLIGSAERFGPAGDA